MGIRDQFAAALGPEHSADARRTHRQAGEFDKLPPQMRAGDEAVPAHPPGYADMRSMREWAHKLMAARRPDFIIGDNYLRRWWVIPRNELCNVYLHEILHSDDDRALHDHPWDNTSMVLAGGYVEHTPQGTIERYPGDVVTRKATDAHRLVVPDGGSALTLFFTGPKLRDWGFHCPQGWRPWQEFVAAHDTGQVGRGCGE